MFTDSFFKPEKNTGLRALVFPASLVAHLIIILIIFGAGKLPEIGSGIGKGIKNFKKATTENKEQIP